jgi:hypothetical protein
LWQTNDKAVNLFFAHLHRLAAGEPLPGVATRRRVLIRGLSSAGGFLIIGGRWGGSALV